MIAHPQSFCKAIGENACYALCIIDIAEKITKKKFEIISTLENAINRGYIDFDFNDYNDDDNFFVRKPDAFLSWLVGRKFSVTYEEPTYSIKKGDYAVEFWSINGKAGHFARTKDGFNSLDYSVNVSKGKIYSYRVFREVK